MKLIQSCLCALIFLAACGNPSNQTVETESKKKAEDIGKEVKKSNEENRSASSELQSLEQLQKFFPSTFENEQFKVLESKEKSFNGDKWNVVYGHYLKKEIVATLQDYGGKSLSFNMILGEKKAGDNFENERMTEKLLEENGNLVRIIERKNPTPTIRDFAFSYEVFVKDRYYVSFKAPLARKDEVIRLFGKCNMEVLK